MRLRLTLIAAFCTVGAASAQDIDQNTRFEGTVRMVNGSNLIVTTGKGDVLITLTPHTRVLIRRGAEVDDIKGSYFGTANQNAGGANTGTAQEVHLLNNGPNTNSPMNDQGLTMTSGHVTSLTDVSVADLKPGVTVGANTTKGADGKFAATFIAIEAGKTE